MKNLYQSLREDVSRDGLVGAMKKRREAMRQYQDNRPLKALRERLKMKKQEVLERRTQAQTAGGERGEPTGEIEVPSQRKLFTFDNSPTGR
jgi:hypothetical protein